MVVHNLDTGNNTSFDYQMFLMYTEFSPSGKYIFTLAFDQTIRLY
jgi:hypothetical protein